MTFWLLVIVLTAWGVSRLWGDMIKPKAFNTLLLPGTLMAQIGHVIGLLVTGATISNTTLIKDDESGAPETTADPRPRIPIIGPVVIGILPLLSCALGIFLVARYLSNPLPASLPGVVSNRLPISLPGWWELVRNLVTLVEATFAAVTASDFSIWRTWLFGYLLVCMAIRMAPFPGYLRGSLGAIVVLGVGASLLASLFAVEDPRVQSGWVVLNLTVATLMLLLVSSLIIRGVVGLVRALREDG